MEIKYRHYREVDGRGNINSRGGATLAFAQDTDDTFMGSIAYCSYTDNYNKAYGRAKAVGLLLKNDKSDDSTFMGSLRHITGFVGTAKEFIEAMDRHMAQNEGYDPR